MGNSDPVKYRKISNKSKIHHLGPLDLWQTAKGMKQPPLRPRLERLRPGEPVAWEAKKPGQVMVWDIQEGHDFE